MVLSSKFTMSNLPQLDRKALRISAGCPRMPFLRQPTRTVIDGILNGDHLIPKKKTILGYIFGTRERDTSGLGRDALLYPLIDTYYRGTGRCALQHLRCVWRGDVHGYNRRAAQIFLYTFYGLRITEADSTGKMLTLGQLGMISTVTPWLPLR